jgi:hypothetical protein
MKAIVTKILGQNWLVDANGWQKVADDYMLPEQPKPEAVVTVPKVLTVQVNASKPGSYYTVTRSHGHYSCTCKGYEFRSKCRHIEETKLNYD